MKAAAAEKWVSTGQMAIVSEPGSQLLTSTASGVAVVLHCRNPLLLGMAHVVLPSAGSGREDASRPALRAQAGTRLLYEEMLARGARWDRLRASIAGGADVLGHSSMGGTGSRNIDAVKRCLISLKIRLVQARTGGSQGLRVRVCIDDGRVESQPTPSIAKQLHRSSAGWNPPQRLRKEILSQLEQLRCDSTVCGQVSRDLRASKIDWPQALGRMNQDPVLVLSLLRLGNSVSCGKPGQMDSLASGLACLGPEGFLRICKMAISQAGQGMGLSDLGITPHRFYGHALEAAGLARSHAMKHRPELADLVHTAGLLHGLRPVVVALASGTGSRAGQYVTAPPRDQSRGIEASLWGQLTASVLLEWNLPSLLVRAISGPGPQSDLQLGSSLERLIVSCCRLASQRGSADAGKYRCPWQDEQARSPQ